MNAKKATFKVLDSFNNGTVFSGDNLAMMVRFYVPETHHIDTYLRYMREYRDINGVSIPCIAKAKSLYQMGEKQ